MTNQFHKVIWLWPLALMACATFPQLDDTISQADRDAPYPSLSDLDAVLASAPAPSALADSTEQLSRISALKARASRLRLPVLSQAERNRLRRGVAVAGPNR